MFLYYVCIASYLPYGVNVELLNYKKDYVGHRYSKVTALSQWSKCGKLWSIETDKGAKSSLADCKLVLRPMSDLSKEIDIDGKKIVPLYALMNEDKGFCKDDIEVYGYESLKVSVYELLLKWHFDIFDLISRGHAVNINDVKF